jgi:ubiquitin carboxyl-terminal hydrolase 34
LKPLTTASQIYSFLVKLPGDENVMKAIEDPSTPYSDIFPSGQPFKSLYAVHAVREYLASQRRKAPDGQLDVSADKADDMSSSPYPGHVQRAMALIVSAICDEEVIEQCPSQFWRIELSSSLVECLLSLLKGRMTGSAPLMFVSRSQLCTSLDPFLPASAARFLDSTLLDRLLGIMTSALSANTLESATKHIPVCLQSILESCSASQAFISAFCTHGLVPGVLETALLYDTRVEVRQSTALFILGKISGSSL